MQIMDLDAVFQILDSNVRKATLNRNCQKMGLRRKSYATLATLALIKGLGPDEAF